MAHIPTHRIEFLLVSTVLCFVVSLAVTRRVHAGLASWDDVSVASVRRRLNSWVANEILFFIAALWLADIVDDLITPHHIGSASILIFPVTSILDLRRHFNPKPALTPRPVWQELQPIQSTHWGEPPARTQRLDRPAR